MKAIKNAIARLRYAAGQVDLKLADDADTELAALREAGEKMHSLVKEFLSSDENTMLGLMVKDALAEWKAANK